MNKRIWLLVSVLLLPACGSPEEQIEKFVENANAHMAAGDYDSAHIEFRNALKINPNHVGALYAVTKVFEHNKEYQNSYRYLQRVLELDPTHVDAMLAIGTMELGGQQLDKALERGEVAARISPDLAKVKAYNAIVRLKLGDNEAAVQLAREALKLETDNLEAIIVLGSDRLLQDKPLEAIEVLDQYQGELSVALELMKVQAFNRLKDLDGAVDVFEKLIQEEREDGIYTALVKQYLSFGKIEEADAVFKRLIADKPENLDHKFSYISFLNQFVGEGRAAVQLKSFIRDDPKNARLNFQLVELYRRGGLADEAKEALIKLTAFDDIETKVGAFNRLAKMEFGEGNSDKGEEYLQQALALDSKSQDAIVTQAQRKLQRGDIEQAIIDLRSVLQEAPNSALVLGLLGSAHEKQGKLELALDHYGKAYDSEPRNRTVVIAYTQLMNRQGQYVEVEKVFDRYLRVNPNDMQILQLAAANKLALKKWDDAQLIAERLEVLEQSPGIVDRIRGFALMGKDDQKEGQAAFQRSYELSEDKTRAMDLLIRSYLASGDSDKAQNFLQSVLDNDAGNLVALNLMAKLRLRNGDLDAAENLYRQAVSIHPENLTTYLQLSSFLMRQGRPESVIELLNEIDGKGIESSALMLMRANAYEAVGNKSEAIKAYELVLEQQPELDLARNNLAVLLSDDVEYQDLERAKELALPFKHSEVPYFLDTLGWIYYKTGDFNNALYFHENAVQAMPEFAEFRYHLGMSYKASGEPEKAKVELEKALRLAGSKNPEWKTHALEAITNL